LFIDEWYANVENSFKASFYKLFKYKFKRESFLSLPKSTILYLFIRFRTRNHHLPKEIGNWARIQLNDRLCTSFNKLGDEFHFLFECKIFENERKRFLKPYYFRRPNIIKTSELMNTNNKQERLKVDKFVKCILSRI
jgi:hypothetical protein